jgi:hypothetical protein
MRLQFWVITGALSLAGLAAGMLGADSASDTAAYAAWGLIPVYWLLRVFLRRSGG